MSSLNKKLTPQIVVKYLKSLSLVNTASIHTLTAYAGDLSQFFSPEWGLKFKVKRTNPSPSISILVIREQQESTQETEISAVSGPQELGEVDLMNLYQTAKKTWSELSPSTRNRKFACLKSFFKWLFQENQLETDLSSKVNTPKVPRKLPHFISVDEVMSVLSALSSSIENNEKDAARDEVLILLLYGGGLRVSEAGQLSLKNVRFSERTLLIDGKGGKQRIVTPPPIVFKKLEAFVDKDQTYIFGAKPLSNQKAYNIVKKWGSRAGLLKPLHPHALRHSFATHLLSSGANLRTLQELLGHSSLMATEKYTHVTVDELGRTMNDKHPLSKLKK
ncbi:MAG: site-specific recombinase [Bdellovibrionaceae bacterium]|nr:site-specific recombinase [Pseudobdellovibrionaceae bacterium]|tara:strand:+ start:5586 stop:6584 length:999 start_codon:yes stop_codon:yes gene_type:complete